MKTEYLLMREAEHVLTALTPANRLAMKVCLHTGLRLSDVLSLRTEQIGPTFWVRESKTGKSKRVGLPQPLLRSLQLQSGREWVFESRSDTKKHRTRQAVYRDVKRAAKAFRLPQNVAPHSFRKLYAVELLEKYGDIQRVQRALNHGSLATTIIYAAADKLLTARGARRKGK